MAVTRDLIKKISRPSLWYIEKERLELIFDSQKCRLLFRTNNMSWTFSHFNASRNKKKHIHVWNEIGKRIYMNVRNIQPSNSFSATRVWGKWEGRSQELEAKSIFKLVLFVSDLLRQIVNKHLPLHLVAFQVCKTVFA